ncbi:MAG: hypothetical protein JW955_22525 [Sedimentisphaerales bacterium]|nr:hypothetical protein [Sedimentisphaerales bacterium]
MRKRILFIAVVILAVSSVASAGVLKWFFPFYWQQTTADSQTQVSAGNWGLIAVNVGPGSTGKSNPGGYNKTQTTTTPSGDTMTQSTSVTGIQTTSITGGAGSMGASFQTMSVVTYQSQSVN